MSESTSTSGTYGFYSVSIDGIGSYLWCTCHKIPTWLT